MSFSERDGAVVPLSRKPREAARRPVCNGAEAAEAAARRDLDVDGRADFEAAVREGFREVVVVYVRDDDVRLEHRDVGPVVELVEKLAAAPDEEKVFPDSLYAYALPPPQPNQCQRFY